MFHKFLNVNNLWYNFKLLGGMNPSKLNLTAPELLMLDVDCMQAFKKARSMGLGDLDFSAVFEAVKFPEGSS